MLKMSKSSRLKNAVNPKSDHKTIDFNGDEDCTIVIQNLTKGSIIFSDTFLGKQISEIGITCFEQANVMYMSNSKMDAIRFKFPILNHWINNWMFRKQ